MRYVIPNKVRLLIPKVDNDFITLDVSLFDSLQAPVWNEEYEHNLMSIPLSDELGGFVVYEYEKIQEEPIQNDENLIAYGYLNNEKDTLLHNIKIKSTRKSNNKNHVVTIHPSIPSTILGSPVWFYEEDENQKIITLGNLAGICSCKPHDKKLSLLSIVHASFIKKLITDSEIPNAAHASGLKNASDVEVDAGADGLEILTHFTRDKNILISILENGFLYLHNETQLLLELLGLPIILDSEPVTSGMVCFTDTPVEQTKLHQKKYGSYGVVVCKRWLIAKGAQRVAYLDKNGTIFDSLKTLLKLSLPQEIKGESTLDLLLDENSRFETLLTLTCSKFAQVTNPSESYVEILKMHDWFQTDQDVADREWRVRNPGAYTGIQELPKSEQALKLIELINDPRIQHSGTDSLSLKVSPDDVRALLVPGNDADFIKGTLKGGPFENVQIIDSDTFLSI